MRFRSEYLIGVVIILVTSLFARQPLSGEETDPPRISLDRDNAEVLCVSEDWAVWRTSELIETNRYNRGPRFIHRIYRQRLAEPDATFAFRIEAGYGWGTGGVTIKSDGTIVFLGTYCVKWCDPDGTLRSSEIRSGIRRVY